MPSRVQRSESPITSAEAPADAAITASGPAPTSTGSVAMPMPRWSASDALASSRLASRAALAAHPEQVQRHVAGQPGSHLDRGPVVVVAREGDEDRGRRGRGVVLAPREYDDVADRARQHGLQIAPDGAGTQRVARRGEHQHGGVLLGGQAHRVGAPVDGGEGGHTSVDAARPGALAQVPEALARVADVLDVAQQRDDEQLVGGTGSELLGDGRHAAVEGARVR